MITLQIKKKWNLKVDEYLRVEENFTDEKDETKEENVAKSKSNR